MSEFLKACRGEATSYTPIWLMRQAGRYQAEYRALKAQYSFMQMVQTPEIATQVTMLPIKQFELDAAILFADILLVLEPLGVGFEFDKEHGPRIGQPLRTAANVDAIAEEIHAADSLGYVMRTIELVKQELSGKVPLIGFAGAPFTLASYMIEGGGSRDYLHTKEMMFSDRGAWDTLMTRLVDALADYLLCQVRAGVDALQIFDSWIGCLSPHVYETHVQPHMARLFAALRQEAKNVPVIHFGTGNPSLYPAMAAAGGDVIGVDWRVDLGSQWQALGNVSIQGNMDPGYLLAPKQQLHAAAQHVLDSADGRPGHIFNLGHGIFPRAPIDSVRALVDYVHEASSR
ncbi:MAG: uroporphyrinogen decarboxylase [Myxococcales bacterium]|nr:uroporphyrinogen decarboxylase [Myxococcales bacterium]